MHQRTKQTFLPSGDSPPSERQNNIHNDSYTVLKKYLRSVTGKFKRGGKEDRDGKQKIAILNKAEPILNGKVHLN